MDDICAEIDALAEKDKRAAMANSAETKYKQESEKLAKILEENDPEAITLSIMQTADDAIDGFVEYLIADSTTANFIDSVAFKVSEENLPVAREYIALLTLHDQKKALDNILDSVFYSEVDKSKRLRSLPRLVTTPLKGPIKKIILGELDSKLSDAREALRLAGNADLADSEDVFSEIKVLKKEFEIAEAEPYVIPWYHDGQMELVETDPNLADLIKNRYVDNTKFSGVMGTIGSVMLAINRLSRSMQTTFNPKSFRNQWFRDTFNAWLRGGAYYSFGYISKELQNEYADVTVQYVKNGNPENWKFLEEKAQELETTPEALAIEMIFARASSNSISLTKFMQQPLTTSKNAASVSYWGSQAEQTKTAAGKLIDALQKIPEQANESREVWERQKVIRNTILKSLRNNKTIEEAIRAAQFAGANATTNYGRMLVHMENFRRTVNYFGAGVNGFKSFWRMFELDPIGITTRMSIGILIPIIAATIFSLSNEKSRKVYRALREYDKKNQLVVVVDGKIYNIPIPQEMYGITSTVRTAVESLFDGNRHAFWELAMNDLLGFGPVDFSDFMDIDANRFGDDPTFLERMGGLGLSFVNQFSDVATRSIIEAAFNIDTFTGKRIDTSYKEFDDEGNLIVVNPNSTGKLAEEIGNLTGWSAPIISHTLKNIIGQVGQDVINTVIGGQSPLKLLETGADELLNLEGSNYDRISQEWNAYISDMWRQKESLLEQYNEYSAQINRESNPDVQDKLRTDRQNLIDPFLKSVANAVNKLKTDYPGSYDQFRFASVVSLLTFDTGTTTGDTAEQRASATNNYYENLERTYMWMQKLGIQSSDNNSLLGYLKKNSKGEIEVKYNTPTSILAAREAYMGKGDRNAAELKMILKSADINSYDRTNSDEYKAAKAAGKQALKDYKAEWNTKVIKALSGYIQDMGVDNVMANDATRDLLNDYIFVDNPYKIKEYLTKIFKEAK